MTKPTTDAGEPATTEIAATPARPPSKGRSGWWWFAGLVVAFLIGVAASQVFKRVVPQPPSQPTSAQPPQPK